MLEETLLKKKISTDAELESTRWKVRERLNHNNKQRVDIHHQKTPSKNIEKSDEAQGNQAGERRANQDQQLDEMYQSLSDETQRRWGERKHLDMEDRDPLPKVTKDKKAKKLLRTSNQIIADITGNYKETVNITSINQLAHATAAVITESIGMKLKKPKQNKRKQPKWKKKLEKDMQYKRKELSMLSEMEKDQKQIKDSKGE